MYDRQVKGGKSSYTHDKSAVAFTEENIFPLTLVCSALSPFFSSFHSQILLAEKGCFCARNNSRLIHVFIAMVVDKDGYCTDCLINPLF